MSVYKRKNKYWINISFDRQRYRLPSPENTLAGAKAYEASIRHDLANGIPVKKEQISKDNSKLNFKEFSKEWFESYVKTNNKHSEILNKESVLRVHLNPFFGNLRLNEISSKDIEKYKAQKMQEGQSNKSIRNHLIVYNKCLNTAKEWKLLVEPTIAKLPKVPVCDIHFLKREECEVLLNNCEGLLKDMVFLALNTGLRFGELIALKTSDIDLDSKRMIVQRSITRGKEGTPKSNKVRYIPLNKDVIELLKDKLDYDGFLFCDDQGNHLNSVTCLRWLKKACDKGGLERIGWHKLRHTFASHLVQGGTSMAIIQKLLGHSDIKTTMQYAHLSEPVIQGAIDGLDFNSCHYTVTKEKQQVNNNIISSSVDYIESEISK